MDKERTEIRTPPLAEIIAIGDELTSGQRLDTNSQWLSQQLADIGIRTIFHSTVCDQEDAMQAVMNIAIQRSDIVLVTGGLGPTDDDLTRQVIADTAGVGLQMHEPTVDHIQNLFESRGRVMPANNRCQALFPIGCKIIPNHGGTAPGVDFTFDVKSNTGRTCRLFALPGVPAELKPMWTEYVAPAIKEAHPQIGTFVYHSIHCFGLAESNVEELLPGIIDRKRVPMVGITASSATITLRILGVGQTVDECQRMIEPTVKLIREKLTAFMFGENGATLEDVVVDLLKKQNSTFAVVDLGSCGLIADWMSLADPERAAYRGTLSHHLGTDQSSIKELVGIAMNTFQCDLVLAIGPTFTHSELLKRDLSVWKLDESQQLKSVKHRVTALSNPAPMVPRSIKQALNFLRTVLIGGKV